MAQFTRVNQMMGADLNTSLRVFHCHRNIWRYSPGGAENSSGAHGEQPGPLQSPTSHGDSQLAPLHVHNQSIRLLGLCKVRGS